MTTAWRGSGSMHLTSGGAWRDGLLCHRRRPHPDCLRRGVESAIQRRQGYWSASSAHGTNIGAFHEGLSCRDGNCRSSSFAKTTCTWNTAHRRCDRRERSRGRTRQRYGLESIIIDGQDADVVYRTAKAAYDASGGGPSLIECLTYRYSGHSRADPAKYRPEGELDFWRGKRDPIRIYRERLP